MDVTSQSDFDSFRNTLSGNYNKLKLRILDCFCFTVEQIEQLVLEIGCPKPARIIFRWASPDVEFANFNDLSLAETAFHNFGHPFVRVFESEDHKTPKKKRVHVEHAFADLPPDEQDDDDFQYKSPHYDPTCRPYRLRIHKRFRGDEQASQLSESMSSDSSEASEL